MADTEQFDEELTEQVGTLALGITAQLVKSYHATLDADEASVRAAVARLVAEIDSIPEPLMTVVIMMLLPYTRGTPVR